jgi:CelD/BcsL family acetyltransferase involved in cellulose biosynthesis
VRVVELTRLVDLEAIRRPWAELAGASVHDTPYVLPEFLLPWMRRMDDGFEYRCLAAWDDDMLVGFAPLVGRRIGRAGLALSLRVFPEVAPSPPCDILVHPGAHGVEEAILAHWCSQNDWDAIELNNVPPDSPALDRLAALAAAAALPVRRAQALSYYCVPVSGCWEDYLAARSKKMRQNLRRGRRYLERLGAVRFASYPGDMNARQAREQAFEVVGRSWKHDESGPRSWNEFLLQLIEELDRAQLLRLEFLTLDARAIAFLLDVPFKGGVFAVHNGYDLRFQPGNPGQLLLARSIEAAHRSGANRYVTGVRDDLRHWSALTRPSRRLRIERPSLAAQVKLRAFDWVRTRRRQRALDEVDRMKDSRKQALRTEPERDTAE